jgi:hypothetical protein
MRMKALGVAILTASCALGATGSGCATTKNKSDDKDYAVICTDEKPTGSNISRFRCRKRWQVEDRRASDRAAMERIQFDTRRPGLPTNPSGS